LQKNHRQQRQTSPQKGQKEEAIPETAGTPASSVPVAQIISEAGFKRTA